MQEPLNNIYQEAETPALYKYLKTVPSKLSGKRLEPMRLAEVPFRLISRDNEFDYTASVIELYSEREHRHFLQANKKFISAGLLEIYTGDAQPADLSNVMSAEDVEMLASIKTIPGLRKALQAVTSKITMARILDTARFIGRPQSVITVIEDRMNEL